MPIRPENVARYPKNWKSEVVPRIRARSGNRCECTGQCGIGHTIQPMDAETDRCWAMNGEPHPITGSKVVLTVMHLDHQPENNADENLLHACQGCHNRYDAPMRRAGIKERARAAKAAGDLFQCSEA